MANINNDYKKGNSYSKSRSYPCKYCGGEFKASPPDKYHTTARTFKVDRTGVVEVSYECQECKKQNTLFWSSGHR